MNTLRETARARLRGALLGLTTPFTSAGTFDEETFRGLARLRAMECRAPDRYAEAFHARKMTLV